MEGRRTLLLVGLCGLVAVLMDADHAVAAILDRVYPGATSNGRLFHVPMFMATGFVICCLGAYLGRLHHKPVLTWGAVGVFLITVLVLKLPTPGNWGWKW